MKFDNTTSYMSIVQPQYELLVVSSQISRSANTCQNSCHAMVVPHGVYLNFDLLEFISFLSCFYDAFWERL